MTHDMRRGQGLQTHLHPLPLIGQRICTDRYLAHAVRTHVRVVLQVCAVFATPAAAQIAAQYVSNNNYRLVEDLVK